MASMCRAPDGVRPAWSDSGRIIGWDPNERIIMVEVVESDRSEANLADNFGEAFYLREAPVYRLDDKVLFSDEIGDDHSDFGIAVSGANVSISIPLVRAEGNWPLDVDYTNVYVLDESTGALVATARMDTTATQASFDLASGGGSRVVKAIAASADPLKNGWGNISQARRSSWQKPSIRLRT